MIAKLERIPLSDVGWHEALDFTRWLQENIDAINEITDLELSGAEREKSTGTFRVDIVAENRDGNRVIIENQLGKSDHDHLGKLITYLTAMEARAAVWIVSDPRPEHVGAITWLNESSGADFYLLKVEAVKIAGPEAAPLLTLIVGPGEESKRIRKDKEEFDEWRDIRFRFWEGLLSRAKEKTTLHSNISPSKVSWIAAGAGIGGLSFNYVIRQVGAVNVELYIDRGKDSEQKNRLIFDQLYAHRKEIEDSFGGELMWEPLETRKACRIKKDIGEGGCRDEAKWPEMQEAMVEAMVRFERALRPHIDKLSL